MSELGDLLELLHSASDRVESVESRWRLWRHEQRARDALVAHAKTRGGTTFAIGRPGDREPEVHEEEVRYWFARPDRKREEHDGDAHGTTLAIQVGSTWWSYSSQMGAMTNAGDEKHGHGIGQAFDLMLNPAPILGLLDFEITGQSERAQRPVIQARCTPREGHVRHDAFVLHPLGFGADAYTLDVDAEHGLLLRTEAQLNGMPMTVCEAIEITFDQPLDPALFRFSSPDGQEPSRVDLLYPRAAHVPLHQAVAAVPFTVYTLPHPAAGWELRVTLQQGSQRPPIDPGVWLHYRSDDAANQLNIGEMSVDCAEDYRVNEGEEIERDGRRMRVRRRTDTWPQAQLSVELNDTLITMNSDTLTAEDLVDIVGRLTPASADPPAL